MLLKKTDKKEVVLFGKTKVFLKLKALNFIEFSY